MGDEHSTTTINGDVHGAVLSGVFNAPVYLIIQQHYPLLKDYVYDVDATIETVTQWFVGREFVFEWLEAQLRTFPCGYLRLIADAGLGKTAIAAEIARRYGALAHFVNASQGITRPDQCLNHLSASLIARYDLPHDYLPERAGLDSNFLQTLLQEAAEKRGDKPVLLVIDALDEADPVSAGCNWLHLPDHLPEGVFVLLTHRSGDYPVVADARTPQPEPLVIAWDDPSQQNDIAAHLWRQAERPEILRALEEAAPPITVEQFVSVLQAASEGNFMYLAYVLADIENREPGFAPLDLQGLPRGLHGYYEHFWQQMEQVKGQEGWAEWKGLYRPVIELLGVAGEPVTADWLADHSGCEAGEIEGRALARWVRFLRCERRVDGARTWRIVHRSFADFLAEKVDLSTAHRRVASYYLAAWGKTDHHSGYGLRYLTMHLNDARWWEPLHALFTSDAWLHMRVPADDYTYDGYLTDLDYAWRHAEVEARQQIAEEMSPDALAECIRCVLIHTTVNSLSDNYEPELAARAVEVGLWTTARALSIVDRMPEAKQRAKLYTLLLGLKDALTPAQRQIAQTGGLAAAQAIWDEKSRVDALAALAPQLADDLRRVVLTEGLKTAREIKYAGIRAEALATLAPQLTSNLLTDELATAWERALMEELAAIRELPERWCGGTSPRTEALMVLAPYLTGNLVAEGTSVVETIENEYLRTQALAAITAQATGKSQEYMLVERLEDRAQALVALATQLTGKAREYVPAEALATARAIEHAGDRAQALAALAIQLTGEAREYALAEGLAAARMTGNAETRALALSALASQLTGEERERILVEGLAVARAIECAEDRAQAMTSLVSQMTGKMQERVLAEALVTVQAIEDERDRANALISLAPKLTGSLLAEGLAAVQAIENEKCRSEALKALSPHLENTVQAHGLLTRKMAAARAIEDDRYRADVLAALIPHLTRELLAEGLASARIVEDEWERTVALAALAPHLINAPQARELLTKRLSAARAIRDERRRVLALAALAPHLTNDLMAEALSAARAIQNEEQRVQALVALSPYLTVDLLAKALSVARAIRDEKRRVQILTILAPHLMGDLLVESLTTAREIEDEKDRAKVLVMLAPQLTNDLIAEALSVMQTIQGGCLRVKVLAAISAQSTGKARERVLAEALSTAQTIWPQNERAEALAMLAPQLTAEALAKAIAEKPAVQVIGNERERSQALIVLAPHLTGSLLAEGLAAARTIGDKSLQVQALAALARQLTGDARECVLADALTAARELPEVGIFSTSPRVEALAMLAPQLAGEIQEHAMAEALSAACKLPEDYLFRNPRAEALALLAPHLTSGLLAEGLVAAQAIENEWRRTEVLKALVPRLTDDLLAEGLAATQTIKDEQRLVELLTALAPRLTNGLFAKKLVEVREISDVWRQTRVLTTLAPYLPDDLLAEGLVAVRTIRWESERAKALLALLPRCSGAEMQSVRGEIQTIILALLRAIKDEKREAVLQLLADKDVFNSGSLFAPETITRITKAVTEVCYDWVWV